MKHDQIDHSDKINDQAQPPFEKELVSSPSSSQLVEELLVELLVALFAPHWEEDVAADELVDHFAIRRKALQHKYVKNILEEGSFLNMGMYLLPGR